MLTPIPVAPYQKILTKVWSATAGAGSRGGSGASTEEAGRGSSSRLSSPVNPLLTRNGDGSTRRPAVPQIRSPRVVMGVGVPPTAMRASQSQRHGRTRSWSNSWQLPHCSVLRTEHALRQRSPYGAVQPRATDALQRSMPCFLVALLSNGLAEQYMPYLN